jgi:hypothetical protein
MISIGKAPPSFLPSSIIFAAGSAAKAVAAIARIGDFAKEDVRGGNSISGRRFRCRHPAWKIKC